MRQPLAARKSRHDGVGGRILPEIDDEAAVDLERDGNPHDRVDRTFGREVDRGIRAETLTDGWS